MGLWNLIKPSFWEKRHSKLELLNYRRLWKNTFWSAIVVTLAPLFLLAAINFYQFQKQYELQFSEITNQMQRLLATSKLQVSYFLDERKAALAYVNLDNTFEELSDIKRLSSVFSRLRKSFGGFVDLGLIDARGIQQTYVGPYNLEGHNYKNQDWYQEVMIRGIYISDVFLGHRNFPHFVIAVRHESENEPPYVLRATIDTDRLNSLMKAQDIRRGGDLFLVNQAGMLQTSSELYGQVLTQFPLVSDQHPMTNGIYQTKDATNLPLAVGVAEVEGTPFNLVAINKPKALLHRWDILRINVMIMVGLSVMAMLLVIYWGSNTLVGRIYDADLRRVTMLHEMEYTNKLASIGRLAAGVAHEINNPVAIINEKVGLMTDILAHTESCPLKDKFLKQAEVIKDSVRRVSRITHRLLGFARHLPIKSEQIHLVDLIKEVLGLLGREAEYRNIQINLDGDGEVPPIMADKGQLQQVFLNILNNALAAVSDGGRIDINVAEHDRKRVAISIYDNGEGIKEENLKNIFEPFFSTKGEKGTGLGLSITYGIVQKMGGDIHVESKTGEGTTFRILLPRQNNTNLETDEEEVISRLV
ncbi:sensor histidine kinase [Dethiosulfatarculus sandiegensis]|uniref:histidine kinase n=1 Tax=Dethiosulfatarculus sandiegensis TaxID=1429043 RepID=A0A0D2JBK0_9BACT|nr:PAS domain-containing sensor histidine kinase [Dethiosulfatarculus sandiegensis]KIX13136.1 histidine kinase [Dethiosulfatarculus sandiegensis]